MIDIDSKHEFKEGDDCPFCVSKLIFVNGTLRCADSECWFNNVEWK